MAKKLEIYRCNVCGNIIEVFQAGGGTLVCCGEDMQLLSENTVDASKEKHVPVIEKGDGKVTVKVGSVPHPMEEAHFIQWIEVIDGDRILRQELKPGQAPEATFCVSGTSVVAREYCNLHGHWKAEG